jgi:hypothetical protein
VADAILKKIHPYGINMSVKGSVHCPGLTRNAAAAIDLDISLITKYAQYSNCYNIIL